MFEHVYAFTNKYLENNNLVKSISEYFKGILMQTIIITYMMVVFFQNMNNFSVILYFKVSWYFAVKYDEHFFDDFYTFQKSI